MEEYSLIGIDGNAYSIMGYVRRAMLNEGLDSEINDYLAEAKAKDYQYLLMVSMDMIDRCNRLHEMT